MKATLYPISTLSRRRRAAGFTLIEVSIAMGICATVMMALLALLPLSLDQMRDSRNLTSMARISEDIINDVQLMEWDDMELLDGEVREYDDQGTRVRNVTGEDTAVIYRAEVEVEMEGILVPGTTEERNDYAKRLTIYMGPAKGENVNMKMLAETDDRYTTVSTVIARMDEQKQKK